MIKIKILREAKTINVTKPGLRPMSATAVERYEYLLTPQQKKAILDNRETLVSAIIQAFEAGDKKAAIVQIMPTVKKVRDFFSNYQDMAFQIGEDPDVDIEAQFGDMPELGEFFQFIGEFMQNGKRNPMKGLKNLARASRKLENTFSIIPLRGEDGEDEDNLGFPRSQKTPDELKDDMDDLMGMQDIIGVDFMTGEPLPPKPKKPAVKKLTGKRK